MRAVLDTSALIGPVFDAGDDELAISSITLAELHFGVLVTQDPDVRASRLSRLTTITRLFDPLPVDEPVAEEYGRLAARVASVGRSPRARAFDLVIAATAKVHDARLYTRNAEDLRGLSDMVEIVDPATR